MTDCGRSRGYTWTVTEEVFYQILCISRTKLLMKGIVANLQAK